MRYKQFFPGDKVITIVEYDGVPSGAVGKIATRWAGTAYLVRMADGTFRWLTDRAFASTDPSRYFLEEGDRGVVISDSYQDFAQVGDSYIVYKIIYDVDYYGVLFDDELKWFGGFQLAKYEEWVDTQ
jgi:hypothetical protein